MFLVNISVRCSSWYLVHVKRKHLEIIKISNCGYFTKCGKKYIKILNLTTSVPLLVSRVKKKTCKVVLPSISYVYFINI